MYRCASSARAATSPASSWMAPMSESSSWARTSSSASDMASSGVAEVAGAAAAFVSRFVSRTTREAAGGGVRMDTSGGEAQRERRTQLRRSRFAKLFAYCLYSPPATLRLMPGAAATVTAATVAAATVAAANELGPSPGHREPAPAQRRLILDLLAQLGDFGIHQVDPPVQVLLGLLRRPVRRTGEDQPIFPFDPPFDPVPQELQFLVLDDVHFLEQVHLPSHVVQHLPAHPVLLLSAFCRVL